MNKQIDATVFAASALIFISENTKYAMGMEVRRVVVVVK